MEVTVARGLVPRKDEPQLHFIETKPAQAKAALALVHGYADHGARYDHVARYFAERGIHVIAIDLRGHGKSEGPRGHCSRFGEFTDDVGELTKLVSSRAGKLPACLFGHSFGGLVAAHVGLAHNAPYRGYVLSSPFFGLALAVPKAKIIAGKIASRIVPKLGLPSGLMGKDMTHDPARAKEYDTDPLVFGKATARWFTETQAAQAQAIARAPQFDAPLFMSFGTADGVVSYDVGKAFFDAASSKTKHLETKTGLFHEVLNEPEWESVASKMAEFVLARAAN